MKVHVTILVVLILLLIPLSGVSYSQENSPDDMLKKKRPKQSDFFFNISDTGIGAGMKIYYSALNPDTKIGYGFMISGIRGENEAVVVNPYDPFGYPQKIGNNFFTVVIPVNFTIKKRLFRDAIDSNMRPFVVAEAGPVWGVAFPNRDASGVDYGFGKKMGKGKGQISGNVFAGFGVEVGSPETREIGLTIGFHYMRFPVALGERKDYAGIDLRFSFLSSF